MSCLSSARRVLRLVVAAPVLLVSAACLDDDPTPRPVPTFTRIVLTLAPTGGGVPQTVEITRATSTASGGFTVPSQGGLISARFLNFDGSEDAVLEQYAPEYETRIFLTTGSNVSFARASKHSFSAVRTGAGGVVGTARVQLYDLGTRTEFLGVDVTVNTPP